MSLIESHTSLEKTNVFECEICEKCFTTKGKLKSHINCVHQKFKPFNCELCDKSFSQENHMEAHT